MNSRRLTCWVAALMILGLGGGGCKRETSPPPTVSGPSNSDVKSQSGSNTGHGESVKPAAEPTPKPAVNLPTSSPADSANPQPAKPAAAESSVAQSHPATEAGPKATPPGDPTPDVVDVETTMMEELNKTGGLRLRRQVKSGADGTPINHGKVLEYMETGELWKESHWVDGVKHGAYLEWYKNGAIAQLGEFDQGKMIKAWTWFYPDGQKQREGSFDADNERHGTWTYWDREGNKTREETWEHGMKKR